MKKLTAFFLLAAVLLTGCGSQAAESANTETTAAIVQDPGVSLPTLTVSQGEIIFEAHIGSYNWQIENGDGTSTKICVDAVHPLDIADSLPVLEANGLETTLDFLETPESILVWCYGNTKDDVQLLSTEDNHLQLQPGSHVYLITACWPGTEGFTNIVHYSFQSKAPTE